MFDHFFLYGALPANAEHGAYVPSLVWASYIVASFGSYAGLTLANQFFNATSRRNKRLLHWTGAVALGCGIWSMHFIGMLAYKMRMPVNYNPYLTVISMAIAISVAYFVLQTTSAKKLSFFSVCIGAVLLGIGICGMHYTGMAAMEMRASLQYDPTLFSLSVFIAILASGAALWIIFTLGQRAGRQTFWKIIAALVMGAAICGMHFTGMAAAIITPFPDCRFDTTNDVNALAIAVLAVTALLLSIVTFAIYRRLFLVMSCGIFFTLPLAIIIHQAITALNLDIRGVQKEQYGVYYHSQLVDLMSRLQEVRGMTNIIRNGKNDLKTTEELQSYKEQANQAILSVDEIDRIYGNILGIAQDWQRMKARLLLMLNAKDVSLAADGFKQYSAAIESLIEFMTNVADNSNLSTDSQLDSAYLVAVAMHNMANTMETAARMRGTMAGLLSTGRKPEEWSEQQKHQLRELSDRLRFLDNGIEEGLGRARRANANSGQFIDYHGQTIKPKLAAYQTLSGQMIVGNTVNVSASEVFSMGSELIELYDTLYDRTSDSFLELLASRQDTLTFKKNLVLYSSAVAFLGFLALFLFLYRNLTKTEHAEQVAVFSNRAKSEFLANTSHELRTPLNGILGMTRLLLESNLPPQQHELANVVFLSARNLLEIVNDILDLSKIEAREMTLERIGFDIPYLMESVLQPLQHIAKEKRLSLTGIHDKKVFPLVLGDPTRLGQVLTNIIGNAIKYTDRGYVEVHTAYQDIDDRHVEFHCKVVDTGIGIPKEKQESIFEKFVQADTSTTRKYGGTGLGLAITKELVDLMDGRISVESEIGKGSTFLITIPFEVTDKKHEEKYVRRQRMVLGSIVPEKARVLVAEDHPLNQVLIRNLLQKFGIDNIIIANNGSEALKLYQENTWDFVLMDCHMPEKNGYDVTLAIRELEKANNTHVPIVAMTANAMSGDKEKCLRYGMDEYVSKPIDATILKEVLGQWIKFPEEPAEQAAGGKTSEEGALVNLTALRTITEGDSEMEKELIGVFLVQSDNNLEILSETCALEGESYRWVEAAHMLKGGAASLGAEALRQICERAQTYNGPVSERAVLFAELKNAYIQVKDELIRMGFVVTSRE